MLSMGAVTSACVDAVGAGLVRVRSILPLVIWANVGTSALVLLAARDLHPFVIVLLAAVGLLYYFELDQRAQFRHLVAALLGGGLLFFGIDLVQDSAAAARLLPNIAAAIAFGQGSATFGVLAIAFVLGIGIGAAAGSFAAATVVIMALAQANLLNLEQGMALIYGIGAGSAVALWRVAAREDGTPLQLMAFQALTNLLGAVVLVPLFAIELRSGVPLVRAFAQSVGTGIGSQLASIFVIYQLVAAILVSLIRGPVLRFLECRYPETPYENLAKPRYIYATGDTEPETGVLLIEREQQLLIGLLRDGLESIRDEENVAPEPLPEPQILQRAVRSVSGEISAFVGELVDASPPRETAARLGELGVAQGLLDDLADEVFALAAHLKARTAGGPIDDSIASMVESMHLVLTMLIDELQAPDEFQHSSLVTMTTARSSMVDKLRRELTHGGRPLTKIEQESLLTVTTGYERMMGLVQRYLTTIRAVASTALPA